MNCQEIEYFLLQVENHKIPTQIPDDITAHLQICSHCRNNLYLTQLENEVLMEPREIPAISPDFIQRTMQMLPKDLYPSAIPEEIEQPATKETLHRKKKSFRVFLSTAASVLFLLGAGFFFRENITQLLPHNSTPEIRIVAEEAAAPEAVPEEGNTITSKPAATVADSGASAHPRLHPAAYEITSSSPDMSAASLNETQHPMVNPYQFAPASPYVSSIATYYQEASRSAVTENLLSTKDEIGQNAIIPTDMNIVGLPETFRLTAYTQEDMQHIFQYEDSSHNQFIFTVVPYNSSEPFDETGITQLFTCEDIVYQVIIEGNLPTNELRQILNQIEIVK